MELSSSLIHTLSTIVDFQMEYFNGLTKLYLELTIARTGSICCKIHLAMQAQSFDFETLQEGSHTLKIITLHFCNISLSTACSVIANAYCIKVWPTELTDLLYYQPTDRLTDWLTEWRPATDWRPDKRRPATNRLINRWQTNILPALIDWLIMTDWTIDRNICNSFQWVLRSYAIPARNLHQWKNARPKGHYTTVLWLVPFKPSAHASVIGRTAYIIENVPWISSARECSWNARKEWQCRIKRRKNWNASTSAVREIYAIQTRVTWGLAFVHGWWALLELSFPCHVWSRFVSK